MHVAQLAARLRCGLPWAEDALSGVGLPAEAGHGHFYVYFLPLLFFGGEVFFFGCVCVRAPLSIIRYPCFS